MNKSSLKTALVVMLILFVVLGSIFGMVWYYNKKINSLSSQTSIQANTNNTTLLPIFNESSSGDYTNTATETVLSTGSVVDNLNNVETYDSNTEILQGAKITQLETRPIAGYTVVNKQVSTSSSKQVVVRYVVKATGEMIDLDLVTGVKGLLDTYKAGKVEEAIFTNGGNWAVVRSEEKGDIVSKLLYIPTGSAYELERNIVSIDFFDNSNFVYGLKKGDGYSIKTVNKDTKKTTEIAVLPMTEWTLEAVGNTQIRATFKPTGQGEGVSLLVDAQNGTIKNEVKPVVGLVSKKTSDSKYVLLSEGGNGYNKLLFMNRNTQNIFSLNTNTFLEKCAREIIKSGVVCAVPEKLDKQALYPDTWYKNQIQTKDKLVYKSLTSTSTKLVYNFERATVSVLNPSVTPAGVFFQDSTTLGLYTIR
jgi:hypothetical protein